MSKNLKIATDLLKNRNSNGDAQALSFDSQPKNTDQAFSIQADIAKQQGSSIIGWKCALPINDQQFVASPIFKSDFFNGKNSKTEPLLVTLFANNEKACVEPEIAFKLGKTLPPNSNGYTPEEIDVAVDSTYMALELIQNRYADSESVTFFEKLADCFSNQGLYLGPEIDKNIAYQASKIDISIKQYGKVYQYEGEHQNELPQRPLHWLINFMSKRGITFYQGEFIITGSFAGVVELEFNQLTKLEYKGIGKCQVIFSRK